MEEQWQLGGMRKYKIGHTQKQTKQIFPNQRMKNEQLL